MEEHLKALRAASISALAQQRTHAEAVTNLRKQIDAQSADPSDMQIAALRRHVDAREAMQAEVEDCNSQIVSLEAELRGNAAAERMFSGSTDTPRSYSVTTSSRDVYTAERDRIGERSFFADLFGSNVLNDVGASQRIAAFQSESRAGASTSFGGLVPPSYLIDQAALLARSGRPFADSVQKLPLPPGGTSLIVPRSTTGATAAVQATENTTVSQTDEVWANVTVPVATIAGSAQVSRQSLERGAPGLDQLIFSDLAGAYFAAQDQQVLNGSGTAGQMLGVLNTAGITQATAFTAAATIATFYSKVNGLIASIAASRLLSADSIAMHPRRFAWLSNQLDSQGRPLVVPSAGVNAMGSDGAAGPQHGVTTASFLGLRVVIDPNIPTAVGSGPEDVVIVYRAADLLLWQDGDGMPTDLRFDQTLGTALTVTLVAYGYSAFTCGRYPAAVGVGGGNSAATFGLTNPVF